MAHVDDLTLVTAAQLADTDVTYVGRPGDPDPDRRTTIANLATKLVGAEGPDLITRVNNLEGMFQAGTFTPYLAGSSGDPVVTYASRSGYFYRVGDLVWASASIVLSAIGGGAGTPLIASMPIPPAPYHVEAIVRCSNVTLPAGRTYFVALFSAGTTAFQLRAVGSGVPDSPIGFSAIAANANIAATFVYRSA